MTGVKLDLSEARCIQCGYQLRGLPENRCPECGREFDPEDPQTMRVPGYRVRKAPLWTWNFRNDVMALAAHGTFFSVVPGQLSPLYRLYGTTLWAIALLACGVRWIVGWRTAINSGMSPPVSSTWKSIFTLLLFVNLLGQFWVSSCPHADCYGCGSIGIAYSTTGGPCRNVPQRWRAHLFGNFYFFYDSPF